VNSSLYSREKFNQLPVIGIIRNLSIDEVKEILPLYTKAGFTTVEITMNTPGAGEIIRYAAEACKGSLNVGAGTVCDLHDLGQALHSGAQFIVTPIVSEEVINACVQQKVPVFPGAYTATEIYKAWSMGAEIVKVFPASSSGPEYIAEIKGPLDRVKLLPVGGISLDNCEAFMRAGASGLGIGSQLFNKKMIKEKKWEELSAHFDLFAKKMHLIRQ
jgi:2-dehydro-3-deoxyphosphogluconate aldolase / (4S)-4-hydroxy-2-oxoglutarate aldolase